METMTTREVLEELIAAEGFDGVLALVEDGRRKRTLDELFEETRKMGRRSGNPWRAICSVIGHIYSCMDRAAQRSTNHWAWFQWYLELQQVDRVLPPGTIRRQVASQFATFGKWLAEQPERGAPSR